MDENANVEAMLRHDLYDEAYRVTPLCASSKLVAANTHFTGEFAGPLF